MSIESTIPIQPEPHPFWSFGDLGNIFFPRVGEAILPFREVSRHLRDQSETTFQVFRSRIFTDRYGTIAECEKDLPFHILVKRTESTTQLDKALGIDRSRSEYKTLQPQDVSHVLLSEALIDCYQKPPLWLEIEYGIPRLIDFQDHFFGGKNYGSEWLKAKFQFYRYEYHQARAPRLQSLLDRQDEIAVEFRERPLNPAFPLQDLRDHCRRLQTLADERESLWIAHSISKYCDKDFYSIFFHLVFQKAYKAVDITPLPFSSAKLLSEKNPKLGETTINLDGNEVAVEIRANLSATSFNTTVCINRKDTDQDLGFFSIHRRWSLLRSDGHLFREWVSEGSFGRHDGTLQNRILYIHNMRAERYGDRPVECLLARIAVEIFQREPESRLVFNSSYDQADVFFAGGFVPLTSPESSDEVKKQQKLKMDDLRKRFVEAREAGKLFPDFEDLTSFNLFIDKSSTNPQTQFVITDENDQEQPALVDFKLDASPVTWEDPINHHRVLSVGQGRILPKFFKHDLHRFETPQIDKDFKQ